MRSSGSSTGGNRQNRGGGKKPSPRAAGGGAGKQQRAGRPRPEERRYGKGEGQAGGGPRSAGARPDGRGQRAGQGGGAKGAAKSSAGKPPKGGPKGPKAGGGKSSAGGPKGSAARGVAARNAAKSGPGKVTKSGAPKARARNASAPARPREYDAQIEARNRARHSKPAVKLPKTFGDQEGERLQKVLARAGMGSRRACEDLIEQGRVEVNGSVVVEQGVRVEPDKDEIKVDGLTIASQSHVFFALNKPAGVVASMEDPEGRQCLGDYVQNRETRLFHVGRLDTETEGLILLTNHGELAHRLTHPRYGVKKTYLAAIQGPLPRDLGKRLKDGIKLDDGYARADHFKVVENTGKNYLVEVSLHEGRKHIVRRMLSEAGFPVDKLVRTRFGPIALGDQKSGWLRRMTNTEVGMLMDEVGL
ncbi:23S rRNA pseudouridine2605 synthase [Streptomyces sp. WMMB 714]|uniref:pseudouridine synthase n=1 Tax=Streptomyces sp. WMMB 714 TaxID=1286822 RepID=UPI0005F8614D|nr:pseudouridine synthase [Streptomyces sp. WMMB 714]SCK54161.1 23S rRNA pseudouridine2605 synthase [Streptomyces sp. WMMB 714]